jgi:hypothetical protein
MMLNFEVEAISNMIQNRHMMLDFEVEAKPK